MSNLRPGISTDKATAARDKLLPQVRAMFESGHNRQYISDTLGIAHRTVTRIVEENGLLAPKIKGKPRFDMQVTVGAESRHHVIAAKTYEEAVEKIKRAYPGKDVKILGWVKLSPLESRSSVRASWPAKSKVGHSAGKKTGATL